MKRAIMVALLAGAFLSAGIAEARRTRVVVRGPRGRVTVHTVRPAPVVRVAPRIHLAPVVFGAVVVASLPPAQARVWSGREALDRSAGWTEFTMDVDRRGDRLLLQIEKGAAQVSMAEIVFENGETQVVDFNETTHRPGLYTLIDFRNGRKVDHVRVVARAAAGLTEITLHLVT